MTGFGNQLAHQQIHTPAFLVVASVGVLLIAAMLLVLLLLGLLLRLLLLLFLLHLLLSLKEVPLDVFS